MKMLKTPWLLGCVAIASALVGCHKKQGTVWENHKTAHQITKGNAPLWGNAEGGDGSVVLNPPAADDFIPLHEEDLRAQLADGAAPQPRETPGEAGSALPNADAFFAPAGELASVFRTLYFNTDDHILRGRDSLTVVDSIAAYLRKSPGTFVFIGGHCDERGPQAYNLALGSRRANYVRTQLIERGVPLDRVHTISYGKECPAVDGHNKEAWAKNRRAEFKIYVQP